MYEEKILSSAEISPEDYELFDILKDLFEAFRDAEETVIGNMKHFPEGTKIWGGYDIASPVLGIIGNVSKGLNGWNDIVEALSDDKLTDSQTAMIIVSGVFKMLSAGSGIVEAVPFCKDFCGKLSGIFDISAGTFKLGYATVALIEEEKSLENVFGNSCHAISGVLDVFAGICKTSGIKGVGGFAVPLSVLSSAFEKAGAAFKNGQWALGAFILSVGGAISLILLKVVQSLMQLIMGAMGQTSASISASLMSTVVLIAAGLAILVAVAALIIAALESKPTLCAKGGFPVHGHPFIAREAGPELVGTIGGRTAVINNNQIVESVSRGVYGAFRLAMQNNNSKSQSVARVFLDGRQIAMAGCV